MSTRLCKLVLFDVDGTLLLTAGAGRRAIVAALAEEVGDVQAFRDIRFDGKTDPQIVAEMLEAAGQPVSRESDRVRRLCARYVELLAVELGRPTTRTTLMPGVEPLLDRLEDRPDVVLGLLTGNLVQVPPSNSDPAVSIRRASGSARSAPMRRIVRRFRKSRRAAPSRSSGGPPAVPTSSSSATPRQISTAARASRREPSVWPPAPTR
jgi:beta-phosphoglucomutase-like phosphatase (HAD superfamily)